MNRHLAAVLAADIVDYSRLMDEHEIATLAALRQLRSDILEPAVTEFHGIIIKRMGDGWLAEFGSILDAMTCAVYIQRQLATHGSLKIRIGVHLGDIIHDGEDIYGGGVNIAARLESIANVGGICISKIVYDAVKREMDLNFIDGGAQRLKNIKEPIKVYHCGFGTEPTSVVSTSDRADPGRGTGK